MTEGGRVMLVKPEQYWKAAVSMEVTEAGRLTEVRLVQFLNKSE